MIRVPYKKYIQVLIAGGLSAEATKTELERLKLEFPMEEITAILEETVRDNPKYKEQAEKHKYDEAWLHSLDIMEMFSHRMQTVLNDPADQANTISTLGCDGALRIVEDLPLKRTVIPMAFAGIDDNDIDLICNGRYNISYNVEDFKMFIKYFANFKGWTPNDKMLYISQLPVSEAQLKSHLQIASKNDKNYLLWKLGIAPDKSFDSMLRDMMSDCYYNFKDKQKVNPDDAARWGTLAVRISDRLDQLQNEASNTKDIFSQLSFHLELVKDPAVNKEDLGKDVEVPAKKSSDIVNLEDLE